MPVIHPQTQTVLDALFHDAPHSLLLAGKEGVGLATIAYHYANTVGSHVLTVLPEKEGKADLEKGTITIESVRRLYTTVSTVEPRGRVIIIDYAERMAPAAQNAFLKLLEEPTPGTRFILLTHQPELMLPTITSRSQRIDIKPITTDQSLALLDTLKTTDATKRAQLMFIAEGLPAELTRLAQNDEQFTKRAAVVKDARLLVTGTVYDRLLLAKKYKDSRSDAVTLVEDALKQLSLTIAKNGDAGALRTLSRFEVLHKRLSEQGNVRLQLSASAVL
ncbi:MAG: AAA family ATPase [Candidatus Microsaccharimonas sp.]